MQLFTYAQRTQKNYTVGQAVSQAQTVVKAQHPRLRMCMNTVRSWGDFNNKITLENFSKIVEDLVDDSIFYWWLAD